MNNHVQSRRVFLLIYQESPVRRQTHHWYELGYHRWSSPQHLHRPATDNCQIHWGSLRVNTVVSETVSSTVILYMLPIKYNEPGKHIVSHSTFGQMGDRSQDGVVVSNVTVKLRATTSLRWSLAKPRRWSRVRSKDQYRNKDQWSQDQDLDSQ